jgi:hypothetical protein
MHTCKSRVDASGMPICSYKPRSRSIDWFVMSYNLSRGIHPRPKQNIRTLSRTEDCRIFGVKQKSLHPKNPMNISKNLKEFAPPYHNKAIHALNDDTKGSCTLANRGWTLWECKSVRIDQDPNRSIGI